MCTRFEPFGQLLQVTQPRIEALARKITVGVLEGFLAGIVTVGLGSRLARKGEQSMVEKLYQVFRTAEVQCYPQ